MHHFGTLFSEVIQETEFIDFSTAVVESDRTLGLLSCDILNKVKIVDERFRGILETEGLLVNGVFAYIIKTRC